MADMFKQLKKYRNKIGNNFANAGGIKSDSEISKADPKKLNADELKRLKKLQASKK